MDLIKKAQAAAPSTGVTVFSVEATDDVQLLLDDIQTSIAIS